MERGLRVSHIIDIFFYTTDFHLVYLYDSQQPELVTAAIIIDSWIDPKEDTCRVPVSNIEQAARMQDSPEESWVTFNFKLLHSFGKF